MSFRGPGTAFVVTRFSGFTATEPPEGGYYELSVDFQIAGADFVVRHADIENSLPVRAAPQGAAALLGLALALDAHRGVRQSLQPSHGNAFVAAFAQAVVAVP